MTLGISRAQMLVVFGAALSLSACGGGGADSEAGQQPAASGPTYHADVAPIVASKCASCHADGGIAPFSLSTFGEIAAVKELVRAAVSDRSMPPWLAADGCNEYAHDGSLTDEQIATITGWIDAGAPEGTPAQQAPSDEATGLSRVDLTLGMNAPYTAKESPDEYRCFLIDWPNDAPSFVTGFEIKPGEARTVHHVIAFLIPPDRAAQYEELDASEEGPGYTCFGGPGGGNDMEVGWLGSWAPGGRGGDFPAGTGIEVLPGSKIALQLHYNSANGQLPDQTSIDLKIDPTVAKRAHWQFFTNIAWVLGNGMEIPAGETDVKHEFAFDPTGFISDGNPFVIHSVGLHMHTRGTSATLSVEPGAGGDACLLDIPSWDFHWQGTYDLAKPHLFSPGDRLKIECHWDNSAANQPIVDGKPAMPEDLAWGEGTNDEMCLGALYIAEP
jgi:hypothetical protein